MRAGKLDRLVTIQRAVIARDAAGQEIKTWEDVATVWAQARPFRGGERFVAQQIVGKAVMTFVIRWRANVTVKDRIVYDDKVWDIRDVREVGRHVGFEIDTTARSEEAA